MIEVLKKDEVGYKKVLVTRGAVSYPAIVTLVIPKGALVRFSCDYKKTGEWNGTKNNGKRRANCARVVSIRRCVHAGKRRITKDGHYAYKRLGDSVSGKFKTTSVVSPGMYDLQYDVGKIVFPDSFDMDPKERCGPGIHYYPTLVQALNV